MGKEKNHINSNARTLLLGLLVLLVAVLALMVYQEMTSMDEETSVLKVHKTTTPTATSTVTATSTANPTANWKTYTDTHFNLTFKYPTITGVDFKEIFYKADDALNLVDSSYWHNDSLTTNNKYTPGIVISSLTSYPTSYSTKVQTLKTIYNTQSVANTTRFLMPPSSASLDPTLGKDSQKYIESADGKWRGIQYLGVQTQDSANKIIDVFALVTDGSSKTFQISLHSSTTLTSGCGDESTMTYDQCVPIYNNYFKTLKVDDINSKESIIKDWIATYKKVIDTLE